MPVPEPSLVANSLWNYAAAGVALVAAIVTTPIYLHLLGLDHERLTYYHNGIERRLTDVHGHVIKETLS